MNLNRRILIFAGIVLPVILVAVYSYLHIRQSTIERIYEERRSVASLSAHVLQEKLDRVTDLGLSFSTRPVVCERVDKQDWDGSIDLMKKVRGDFPYIDRVLITDTTGTLMADEPHSPELKSKSYAQRDWYKGFRKTGKPYLSEVYKRSEPPREIVTAFAAPIKNEAGKVRGILVLQVNIDKLLTWCKSIRVGGTGFLYVVDQKGHLAINPQYEGSDSIIDYSSVLGVQKALRGEKNVEILYNTKEKENRLVAYEQIPGYGWAVIVTEEEGAAFSVNNNLKYITIIYSFAILLACGFAYFITREMNLRKKAEAALANLNAELEQKVNERTEALQKSELRYRSLFENMIEGFAYCKMMYENGQPTDFIYLDVNAAFENLTGLKNVVGKKVTEVIPGIKKDSPELFATYNRVALTGIPERFEVYLESIDMWFYIAVYSSEKEYFIAVFDVITQRKKTEQALQQLNIELEERVQQRTAQLETVNKELESFSYSVSHDLRAPLRAVNGYAQMLKEDYGTRLDGEANRVMNNITSNSKKMG
ncbi:MAG TPA: cache domain-containing protein [Bacteroidia bacterium]|nr:cache domain-containing protein [Bacteroidia bacterium]